MFVSYSKQFKPVSRETNSRWVKTVLEKSRIDANLFKPHSSRAAAMSMALLKSVPLEHILSVAGWGSSDTFVKFYKPVINTDSFFYYFVTRLKTPNCFGYKMFFGVY